MERPAPGAQGDGGPAAVGQGADGDVVPSGDVVPDGPRQGFSWMLIALAGFLVGQVVSAVLLVVVAAANGHSHDLSQLARRAVPPAWVVVSGLVGVWIGFVGAVVLASRTAGTGSVRRDMHLEFRRSDFVVGPVIGVAAQLVLPIVYLPLRYVVPHLDQKLSDPAKHLTGGFTGADIAVIAALTVLVVPVVEEMLFRGLFLRGALAAFSGAGRRVGPTLAVVLTGIVFALAHLELLQLLGLALFGVVLSVMALRLDRIGPCILAHAAFNLVAIVAVARIGPAW
jgi:membrane protease YdiL (CAAX protease family)